jgi:hypothetical protein
VKHRTFGNSDAALIDKHIYLVFPVPGPFSELLNPKSDQLSIQRTTYSYHVYHTSQEFTTMSALQHLASQHFRAANSSPQNSTETSEVDPSRCSDSTCFRIRAIPLDWNKGRLLDALKTVQPSIEETMCEIALYPSCGGGRRSQTALLVLNTLTGFFSKIGSNESRYLNLVDEHGGLELDRHFWGLTPLNAPEAAVAELVTYHY